MNIAVIGTGYVGLVVGACLAEAGNRVACVDADEEKIEGLRQGLVPIYEPGLEPLVEKNLAEGRLQFTTDVGAAVESASVVFIAVGTPAGEDGSADLQHVLAVARIVGDHMNEPKVVITKSTVPVGTAEQVRRTIAERSRVQFHVCSNPEFLKEGAAIQDFMKPDRVVAGVDSETAAAVLRELYAPFVRSGAPLLLMDVSSAELTKYTANAMLATRISFMNEIAALSEALGADVDQVRRGIGSDPRIGRQYIFPGPGYGGSCLPKDVKALINVGRQVGVPLRVLEAVEAANERQKLVLHRKLREALNCDLSDLTIAMWGLAFKAQTDDTRESPAVALVRMLLDDGARVRVHDPKAHRMDSEAPWDRVTYAANAYEALDGADALVIVTEWMEFRNPDFDRIKMLLKRPVVVDGRNLYDPRKMKDMGFVYVGIGRSVQA